MWIVQNISTIVVILYSCSHVQADLQRSFKKEWKFQGHARFRFSRAIAIDDNSFLYTICSEQKLPTESNCNVTIETPTRLWVPNKTRKQTCQLKLIGSNYGSQTNEVTGVISVERLEKYRSLIVSWERQPESQFEVQNIIVNLVNLLNCDTTHLTFPIDTTGHVLLSNIVVYPDSFDVIVSNAAACGNSVTCRITYDLEGRKIGRPWPFPNNLASAYTQAVASNSSIKGFYTCGSDMNSWKFRAMHVSRSGSKTNLMTVSVSDPREVYWTTSNSYEIYGICLMGVKRIHCAQFDNEANVKMNVTLKLSGSVQWMAVHNLKEDGILVVTGHCKNQKCRSFRVTRIHKNGLQEKWKDVSGLQLKCSRIPHEMSVEIAENENDFCFYIACAQVQDSKDNIMKSSVKFSVKCISKMEFEI